jgi:hypothetical protein
MKIIQSYWTKPFYTKENDDWEGRKMGGWNHRKYYYMSWALSCLRLKKHYNHIELITDVKGNEALINLLKLPYDTVRIELDKLNHYHEDLWALGKIYSYGIQNEPFMHVDSDVFVWNKFDKNVLEANLIAQNVEIDFNYDRVILSEILEQFTNIPSPLPTIFPENLISSNAGVIGGNNTSFFQEYSQLAFSFVNVNLNNLSKVNIGLSNIIFEQYLFTCLAHKRKIDIVYILHDIGNLYQKYLCDFQGVSHRTKYVHIIGPHKKDLASEQWLEERLLFESPAYYYRIMELIEKGEL